RVSGALDSSYHMVDTTRHVSFPGFSRTAKGETYGYTLSAYAELSYGGGTDQTQIEPFAGVNVTHSRIDDYAESGGGPANLHVGSARKTVPGHIIGVRAAHLVSNDAGTGLQLRGQLGWRHNYGGLGTDSTMRFSAGTTPFTVRGPSIVRDAAVVGAGAEARIGGRTALYVDYDGLLSPDEQNHSLSAGIKVRF
ncbi:MAG: autotransporter domain-containing protein, partial [Alphaproteobacteria bacterium]|nr:autotransporter domain-containing protein [Alphaproteobacteria bacterium]